MNFDDTPQEAAFRAEARAWIDANAPRHLHAQLAAAGYGQSPLPGGDAIAESKAWQAKKRDAGWACLQWPKEYGGRGASPIERVIWQQEEGVYGKLAGIFLIGQGMIWTLLLTFSALLISFVLGHLLGIFSAWRRGSWLSKTLPPTMILIGAFPAFFLAISAVYYLGYQLKWFPTSHAYEDLMQPGFTLPFIASVLQHMALPVLVIVVTSLGGWALSMRNVMISVLGEDYITLAEAKGLSSNRIMLMYAARNALLPSVTAFGIVLGASISGQLLIEQVFSYPGLGYMLVSAVRNADYPLMQGLFLLITTFVLVVNFLVDILYTRLDPRVRAE